MNLVESILSEDYVSASEIFESRLDAILEKKLVEVKRRMQAEAMGGDTPEQRAAKEKAGYRPAHKVLGLSSYDLGQQEKKARLSGAKPAARKAAPTRKAAPEAPAPSEPTVGPNVASGYKKLTPKGDVGIQPRRMGPEERYQSGLQRAKDLEMRGSKGKVAKYRKATSAYRFGRELTGLTRFAGDFVKNMASGMHEHTEENS